MKRYLFMAALFSAAISFSESPSTSALFKAIADANLVECKQAIADGAEVNSLDSQNKQSPFALAINHYLITKKALEKTELLTILGSLGIIVGSQLLTLISILIWEGYTKKIMVGDSFLPFAALSAPPVLLGFYGASKLYQKCVTPKKQSADAYKAIVEYIVTAPSYNPLAHDNRSKSDLEVARDILNPRITITNLHGKYRTPKVDILIGETPHSFSAMEYDRTIKPWAEKLLATMRQKISPK